MGTASTRLCPGSRKRFELEASTVTANPLDFASHNQRATASLVSCAPKPHLLSDFMPPKNSGLEGCPWIHCRSRTGDYDRASLFRERPASNADCEVLGILADPSVPSSPRQIHSRLCDPHVRLVSSSR